MQARRTQACVSGAVRYRHAPPSVGAGRACYTLFGSGSAGLGAVDGWEKEQGRNSNRGGFSSKIHLKTDFDGPPIAFHPTGGEVSDTTQLEISLGIGPDITPRAAITDKGYDSAANRAACRCRGHTYNAGALTFHRFSARRKNGEHGAHGEGVMLLAEPMTDRVIGLAIEVHRRATPGGWPSLLRGVASAEADCFYSVITVFSALPPC